MSVVVRVVTVTVVGLRSPLELEELEVRRSSDHPCSQHSSPSPGCPLRCACLLYFTQHDLGFDLATVTD